MKKCDTSGPPVRPEDLETAIRQRKASLDLLDIPCSVLTSQNGVVYERFLPFSVKDYAANPSNSKRGSIIDQAAYLVALVDSGCFDIANVPLLSVGDGKVTDYIDVSTHTNIDAELHPKPLDALRAEGKTVFWTRIDRGLHIYGKGSGEQDVEQLVSNWGPTFQARAREKYLEGLRLGRDKEWLKARLYSE